MSPDYYGMNTEYYIDLNPYVEAEGVNLDDVLVPGMIDGYYDTDGKLEGFPNHANCFVMAYNKDMFEAAGVPVPEAGWTLKDLADWGQSFAGGEGANQTYGLAKHWVMNNMMPFACGGVPYTDDLSTSKMGEPEIVDSLTLYKELIDKESFPTTPRWRPSLPRHFSYPASPLCIPAVVLRLSQLPTMRMRTVSTSASARCPALRTATRSTFSTLPDGQ